MWAVVPALYLWQQVVEFKLTQRFQFCFNNANNFLYVKKK